jgi:hypothetical protein
MDGEGGGVEAAGANASVPLEASPNGRFYLEQLKRKAANSRRCWAALERNIRIALQRL